MRQPLASVVMPAYNSSGYIVQAVRSILGQTLRDFELLILDDGSTDQTGEVLDSFMREHGDARIRLLEHHSLNQGYARTMNGLFAAARGRYIVPMDSDDVALPRRLERAISFLESRPDLDGCGAGHIVLRSAPSNALRARLRTVRGVYREPDEVAASNLFSGLMYNPTACLRRRVLSMVRPWHDPALPTGSDDDWFERLSAAGARFAVLPSLALLYRRLSGSNSRKHADVGKSIRARVACQAAMRLRPDASPEELALHARLTVRDPGLTIADLPAIRAWFERMLTGHLDPARYGPDALRRVLARNWQRACALAACHDLRAGLRAYGDFAALSPHLGSFWSFLYQYQRRKLDQLCHPGRSNHGEHAGTYTPK